MAREYLYGSDISASPVASLARNIEFSRRSFLTGTALVPVLATEASAADHEEGDLVLRWNTGRTVLTIRIEKSQSPSETVASWDLPVAAFGPYAKLIHTVYTFKNAIRRIVRVNSIGFGHIDDRYIEFHFEKIAGKWNIHAVSDFWSSENGPKKKSAFALGSVQIAKHKVERSPISVEFAKFAECEASLAQVVWVGRIKNTCEMVFNGLLTTKSARHEKLYLVAINCECIWQAHPIREKTKSTDIIHLDGQGLSETLSIAWHKVEDGSLAEPEAGREPEHVLIGRTSGLVENPITISDKAKRIEISRTTLAKIRAEVKAVVRTSDKSVRVDVFEYRSWQATFTEIIAGKNSTHTGPFSTLNGRIRQQLVLPKGELRGEVSGRPQTIDFLADHISDEANGDSKSVQQLSTVIGGMEIDTLSAINLGDKTEPDSLKAKKEKTDTPAFNTTDTSNIDPLDPISARGVPFSAVWHGPAKSSATKTLPLIELDAGVTLRRSHLAVSDANHSSLVFESTELWFRFRPNKEVWTDVVSEIALGHASADGDVARIDLSRARLSASRSVDLFHLDFRFLGLALHVASNAQGEHQIELVRNARLCGHFAPTGTERNISDDRNRESGSNSRGAVDAAYDSRPVLTVEFPPQHILEEAIFRPALPKAPFVEMPKPSASGQKTVIEWKAPVTQNLDAMVSSRSDSEGGSGADKSKAWVDPDNLLAMRKTLSSFDRVEHRTELRRLIHGQRITPGPGESSELLERRKKFAGFQLKFSAQNPALPIDQAIYIGPAYLGPEAAATARAVISTETDTAIKSILDDVFLAVRLAAKKLLINPDNSYDGHVKDFTHALALESRLETAVPLYQLFRSYYRDVMTDMALAPADPPSGWADFPKVNMPKILEGEDLEFVIDLNNPPNRQWHPNAFHLSERQKRAQTAYAVHLKQLDDVEPTEGRVSRRSRLSFKVNCRDFGADSTNSGLTRRLGFSIRDLTNWSNLELSVVRRAEEVLVPNRFGDLSVDSGARINTNPRTKLDHLDFKTGEFIDIYSRLHDIFDAVTEEIDEHHTYLELIARMGFSTNQLARFLTPHRLPDEIYSRDEKENTDSNTKLPTDQSGIHELWSARLITGPNINHGLRVVSSADFRPGVMHRRSKRRDGGDLGNAPLAGDGPPPRGPLAPWFAGPDMSDTTSLKPYQIANQQPNKFGKKVEEVLKKYKNDAKLFEFIHPEKEDNQTVRRLLPLDVLAAYMFRARRKDLGQKRFFRSSLDMYDRHELMLLSGTPGIPIEFGKAPDAGSSLSKPSHFDPDRDQQLTGIFPGTKVYTPRSLDVINLALTSIGASFHHSTGFKRFTPARHITGDRIFDPPTIEYWDHHTELGKDIHVEVLYKGTLCPLGHPASLVKITHRSFLRETSGKKRYVGIPRQRMYIRYSAEPKTYPAVGQPNQGRASPCRTARLLGDATPDIIDPNANVGIIHPTPGSGGLFESDTGRLISPTGASGLVFWPRTLRIPGAEVRFQIVLDEHEGTMPMVFVDNAAAKDPQMVKELAEYFQTQIPVPSIDGNQTDFNPTKHRRSIDVGGRKMRYAAERKSGSTQQETVLWNFTIQGLEDISPKVSGDQIIFFNTSFDSDPALEAANQPPYYPVVTPYIRLVQNAALTGAPVNIVEAAWDGRYLKDGFPNPDVADNKNENEQELYLVLRKPVRQSMGSKGDRSGGIMRPDSKLVALSRLKGPVGFSEIETLKSQLRNTPTNPTLTNKFNSNKPEPEKIFEQYFNPKAKLLGVVELGELMKRIVQLGKKTASDLPELVEQVHFGVEQAGQTADDFIEIVQNDLLTPALTIVGAQQQRIKEIDAAIKKQQDDLPGDIAPLKFEEIFPGVQSALARLDEALTTSLSTSNAIVFALTLGEVFEAGRNFIDVLERVSRSIDHNIKQAATKRLQGELFEFIALWNDLKKIFTSLKFVLKDKDVHEAHIKLFAKKLAEHVVPGKDDDGWPYLPLPYPQLKDEKNPKVRDGMYPERGLIRIQVEAILNGMLFDLKEDGGDGRFDLKPLAQKTVKIVTQRIRQLLDDIKSNAIAPTDPETVPELQRFLLLITNPSDLFIDALSEELDYLLKVWAAYDALSREIGSGNIRVIFARAVVLAEMFVGPLDLSIEPLCKAVNDTAVNILKSLAKLILIDFGQLEIPTIPPNSLCVLTSGKVPNGFKPAIGDPTEPIWNAHEKSIDAYAAVKKAETLDLDKFYWAMDELGNPPAIPSREELNTALQTAKKLADSLQSTTGKLYCDIVNDRRAVEGLEKSVSDFDICDLKELEEKRTTITQAKAIVDNRMRILKGLAEQTESIGDQITALAENDVFQKVLAAGTLAAAIDALDLSSLSTPLKNAVEDAQRKIGEAETELNDLAVALATKISKVLKILVARLDDTLPKATKLLEAVRKFLPDDTAKNIEVSLAQLRGISDDIKNLNGKLSGIRTFKDFADGDVKTNVEKIAESLGKLTGDDAIGLRQSTSPLKNLAGLSNEITAQLNDIARRRPGEIFYKAADEYVTKAIGPGGLNIQGGFAALFEARNTLYGNIGDPSVLLVPIRAGDKRNPVTNFPITDSPEKDKDRLAADAEALKLVAASGTSLSAQKNRAFLFQFLNEFRSQESSIEVILKNVKGLVRQFARAEFLIELGVDYVRDQLEEYLSQLVPASIELSYDFATPVPKEVENLTAGIFVPGEGCNLTVDMKAIIDLGRVVQGESPKLEARSIAKIGAFDIKLIGSFDALTLRFKGARFETGSGKQGSKFKVRYDDFKIGEQLEFVKQLQSFLSPKDGSGPYIAALKGRPGIEAGFSFALGTISIGNLSIFNVSIGAAALLPFDDSEARFRASLSRRDAPFTISFAPYGGSGFFAIEADANGIVGFEASFEFGGAAAYEAGPLTAQGRIMAGIYIGQFLLPDMTKLTEISGTFFAGGSATIWIFNFATSLYVKLGMINGDMTGEAVFSFSFSMGLADFDYSVSFERTEEKGFSSGGERRSHLAASRRAVSSNPTASQRKSVGRQAVIKKGESVVCQSEDWKTYRGYFDQTKSWTGEW